MLRAEKRLGMTDDDAIKEYETALVLFLTYFDAPERAEHPDRWDRVSDRESTAWEELHRRGLLDTPKYFDMIQAAHRNANVLRVAKGRA
jgi:hypothetical protein